MSTYTITSVETYKKGNKSISIKRAEKVGTKRVFFFPVTDDNKRLSTVLYARKYDAVSLGKIYLKN